MALIKERLTKIIAKDTNNISYTVRYVVGGKAQFV